MLTNSKPNLSLKLPTVQPLWKENRSWEIRAFNSCQIFCVMLVVSLSAISNGWRTWNTSDQEEWTENGKKRQNRTFWKSFKRPPTCQPKDSRESNFWKEPDKSTSFTQVWKKSCQTLPRRSSTQLSQRTLTWELQHLSTPSILSTNTILWSESATDFKWLSFGIYLKTIYLESHEFHIFAVFEFIVKNTHF